MGIIIAFTLWCYCENLSEHIYTHLVNGMLMMIDDDDDDDDEVQEMLQGRDGIVRKGGI